MVGISVKKSKIRFIVPLAVILIFVTSGLVVASGSDDRGKLFENLKNSISKEDIKDFLSRNNLKRLIADNLDENKLKELEQRGCRIKHRLKGLNSLECPEEVATESGLREARVFQITDLQADQQIKADLVWSEGITGSGINVVILDTGIDSQHAELKDKIKGQYDFVNNDAIAEDNNGHGTHVAGIIAGTGIYETDNNYAKGVAPNVGIYMLKVCGDQYCYEDDMVAAMEYAVNNINAKIMSISIGGGNYGSHCDSDSLAAKVNWVADHGYTVVVAAGNEGSGVSTPACASKAIAVGAVDKNGNLASWSNTGSALDIVAPGVDILSSYSCLAAGGCPANYYAYMSGTSMATPHVSGVVALLLQAKPGATVSEIKDALYNTADKNVKCGSSTCTSTKMGAGLVNAYGAYDYVSGFANPDSDGDGTPDETDECPTEYGTVCNGCPTPCQAPEVMCWSGSNTYLYKSSSQYKKFCKCADGIYGYQGYGYNRKTSTVYYYTSTSDNENWEVKSRTDSYQVYQVKCSDGNWYATNKDYFVSSVPDSDNDGVPDSEDACPTVAGTSCNGCPNTCSGCAVMSCNQGTLTPPSCIAGTCADTTCPTNGCGVGSCNDDEYGTYTSAGNTCQVSGNTGTCTNNACTLSCSYSSECVSSPDKCWSASNTYLYRSTSQYKKFCKCAEGNYGYKSYSYNRKSSTVYYYVSTSNNENWDVKSRKDSYQVYQVKCSDGNWYATNKDYFFE